MSKLNKYNRVLVVCPGGTVTGGPEALHHLVHELRQLGINASIVYYPFNRQFETPEIYREFNLEVAGFQDLTDDLVIYPEIYPMLALKVKNAKAAIWWLSVDNFFELQHESKLKDRLRYLKRIIQFRRPIGGLSSLKNLTHFSQSEYASNILSRHGLSFTKFYEPINKRFLSERLNTGYLNRNDEILYNPVKGRKYTERLKRCFPSFQFTELKGFNKEELTHKFQTAKVYIDFGHHPGRDRIPREAAIHGCCVVTSKNGSARNDIDIPIDSKYKIDVSVKDYPEKFEVIIKDIFYDFQGNHNSFDNYRKKILLESDIFKDQVKTFFC